MNILNELLEEFRDLRRNGFVSALMLHSEGKKIAGIYGVNIPREILWALDIIPINVYSIDETNIEEADKYLNKHFCSLIKASYGYAIMDKCPFLHFSDIIIGNNMCSKKIDMFSKLNFKKVYIMNEHNDINSLINEFKQLISFLENEFSIKLDERKLVSIITKLNKINKIVNEIIDIYMLQPNIITCADLFNVIYGSQFIFNLDEKYHMIFEFKNAFEKLRNDKCFISNNDVIQKRILLSGAPLAGLIDKILETFNSIENTKTLFSSQCEGENYKIINENKEFNSALAEKYLSCCEHKELEYLINKYKIDAIININLFECNNLLKEHNYLNKPNLTITTNYFESDKHVTQNYIKSFINNI
ncbi:MAG: putative R-2-hydroxyglutaryl-CoA dehydratase subunit [Bacillota bacterium]|nr:putative R-2-hydroxyglutaryl-CoA dehydratase subunit [Bacillota bacterium]